MLIPLAIRTGFRRLLEPAALFLSRSRVSPSAITILGVIPAIAGGVAFARGSVRLGAILMGISGLFDLADGLVARLGKKESRFGAFLDSTLDRYSEIAIFIGLAVLFRGGPGFYGVLLALAGSMMVSYTKARAEGLGAACQGGMLQRPERMVIVILGGLIGVRVLEWAVWVVAVLANLTAVERLVRVGRAMRSTKSGPVKQVPPIDEE
ncbi:MAG: CDP-alcohol phosphatidyltransferase family protein [bacterium]